MISEKQRQAINEQELYEDIAHVQEVRKNDLIELETSKKSKHLALKITILVLSVLSVVFSALTVYLSFEIIDNYAWFISLGFMVASLILLGVSIIFLVARRNRGLKVVREDLAPEFVPDKNIFLTGNETLLQDNVPIIRKIIDDPNKRKIRIDTRKVSRYINPDLTFPKMKETLKSSLLSASYELSESDLSLLLARLGHGRVIFVRGLSEEEAKALSSGICSAFNWTNVFVSDLGPSFDDARRANRILSEEKSSLVLSLYGLGASKAESYFAGYADALADCSLTHQLADGFKLSNNLVVLVYLPSSDESVGIPSCLLRYGTAFSPKLTKSQSKPGPFEAVKTSADEIRYLAAKTVHKFYFDDQFASSFDCFNKFEESKGNTIPNDFENALERMEAVELSFNLSQEEVVGDVLLSNLLPYYLTKYPLSELEAEDSVIPELKREFASSEVEGKIDSFLSSFKVIGKKGEAK